MLLKLTGGALILLGSIMIARSRNKKIDKSISKLKALTSLIAFFRLQIDHFCTPISEIFQRADKELIKKCEFSAFPKSADDFRSISGDLSDDVRALLSDFSLELGAMYRDEQLKSCDYYVQKLKEKLLCAEKESENQKKLNTLLCVCASVGIIILLV